MRISASTRNKRKSLRRRNQMVPAAFFARRIRFERALQGPMPSAAVRDEGALQMRPAPCGYSSAHIFETVLFFLRRERKERFQSSKKRKRTVRNLKCSPCRHRVRRRLFRSASTGAAKAPHPQPPSSFPNCDRFTGSQFGFRGFRRAARDLDDGGQAAACGYGL